MKKYFVFLVLVLLLSVTACSQNNTRENHLTEKINPISYSYDDNLKTLNDVISYSTNIVKATLLSIDDFDGAVKIYSFEVNEDYTQNTPDLICMYDAYYEEYAVGHSYYLFLCATENPLYPHTIYTTIVKELIIDTTSSQVSTTVNASEINVKTAQTETIILNAVTEDVVGTRVQSGPGISVSSDISAVSTEADVVAEIRVTSEVPSNMYASTYTVDLINLLKGSETAVAPAMSLPPNLNPNTTYYVFLKEDSNNAGVYCLFSRAYPAAEVTTSITSELSLN